MIPKYSTGVWWIDLLLAIGCIFLALLFGGVGAWAISDMFRWRREDAASLASIPAKAKKDTKAEVKP